MSLTLVTGKAGSGKSYYLQQDIIQMAKENPAGGPLIYLVPDQMTFQVERILIQKLGRASTRIQVLSFSRLAMRVLQEVGGITIPHIKTAGMAMLIRRIVEGEKGTFKLFRKGTDTGGFIEQINTIVTEFKRYEVDSTKLESILETYTAKNNKNATEQSFSDKLTDLYKIMALMEKSLDNHYISGEDELKLLADKAEHSAILQNSSLYIDGFHSFTPLEMNVLEALFCVVREVKIALTLKDVLPSFQDPEPLALFYETQLTRQKIIYLWEACHDGEIKSLHFTEQRRLKRTGLIHLEENFAKYPIASSEGNDGIHVLEAANRRTEIERISKEINTLVRIKDYRYSDITIITRNLSAYVPYIETIFQQESIPVFIDQKRQTLHHPAVEFLRSLLEVIELNWPLEHVIRMLKTEILFPVSEENAREIVDLMENEAMAFGLRGKKWMDEDFWSERLSYAKDDDKVHLINQMRARMLEPIQAFETDIKVDATISKFVKRLYDLLIEVKVPEKLQFLEEQAQKNGRLREAKEHQQIWSLLLELMDQMVELSGDETWDYTLISKMLDSGAEALKFSLIPPAIDQVVVADMELSRLSNIKAVFLIGVNDGEIPASPDEGSLLSEEDRSLFTSEAIPIAPGANRQLMNENFILYTAHSLASDLLYLSYTLADEEGKSRQPSMWLKQISEYFPNLSHDTIFDLSITLEDKVHFESITSPNKAFTSLMNQMQHKKNGYSISPVWWDVYNWFLKEENYEVNLSYLYSSLRYTNEPVKLKKLVSSSLYGENLTASVSRIEQYNRCPFSQFAQYGLKLRERKTYKLEALDIGNLFHEALKEVAEKLRVEGNDFKDLSEIQAINMSRQIVQSLAPTIQNKVLLSSEKNKYIQIKLTEVVAKASLMLAFQARQTGFSAAGLEVGFGLNETLPPLIFELDDSRKVELVGRIDRVDQAAGENGMYVRIIDYKSSNREINLDDVYEGLAIQMLIYLDVVLTHASSWLKTEVSPAGVLYFHVHDPIIRSDKKLTIDEIEEKIIESFKMKGLLNSSLDALKQMDQSVEPGYRSSVIPVKLKNNGEPDAYSRVISEADYEVMRKYLRRHVEKVGTAILDGETILTPYKKKDMIACTYCPYDSFCQFDSKLETNNFRLLKKIKAETVLENMRVEGGISHEDRT